MNFWGDLVENVVLSSSQQFPLVPVSLNITITFVIHQFNIISYSSYFIDLNTFGETEGQDKIQQNPNCSHGISHKAQAVPELHVRFKEPIHNRHKCFPSALIAPRLVSHMSVVIESQNLYILTLRLKTLLK